MFRVSLCSGVKVLNVSLSPIKQKHTGTPFEKNALKYLVLSFSSPFFSQKDANKTSPCSFFASIILPSFIALKKASLSCSDSKHSSTLAF